VQHQHDPLPFRQPAQRGDQRHGVRAYLRHDMPGQLPGRGAGSAGAPKAADGQVRRHPPHPRLRRVERGDLVPALPGPGERLLGDVLGIGEVAGECVRVPDNSPRSRTIEIGELGHTLVARPPPVTGIAQRRS